MATEKGMYWLAVGILAIGLNSTLQKHEIQWAHEFATHARAVAGTVAQRGLDYAIMAEAMLGRDPADSPRLQAALGRLQGKTARMQANLARQQAQRDVLQARLDAEKMRFEVDRHEFRHSMKNFQQVEMCPRQITVRVPEIKVQVPDVGAQVQAAMKQAKTWKSFEGTQYVHGMESLENLPNADNFDFSSFSNMNGPQGAVQVEIHRSVRADRGGEGPI